MLVFHSMLSPRTSHQPAEQHVAVQAADASVPLRIRNCNRLGRSANPPGFSFSEWLKERRRR